MSDSKIRIHRWTIADRIRGCGGYKTIGFDKTHWGQTDSTRDFETHYIAEFLEYRVVIMKDDSLWVKKHYKSQNTNEG